MNPIQPVLMVLVGFIVLWLNGCASVRFYSEAISGQMEILNKARPIPRVLADERTSAKVRRKLVLVQEVRRFASVQMHLPAERPFGRYTDLGRKYVSWVVYAAPEFSVEGKEWWYPVVGRLEYRGYFDERAAREEGERLKQQGYEVYVGGVEAYSTLGWFRDPVLNTFFRRSDAELAELVFHEITHAKLFIPGDTEFNEAFATATAEVAVARWLRSKGDFQTLALYESGLAKDREIVRLLLAMRGKLDWLYDQRSLSLEKMRQEKAAIFRELHAGYLVIRQRWRGDSHYDRAFAKPWNNARLNTVATYYELVPGFERLWQRQKGDVDAYFAAVAAMRAKSKAERRALLMDRLRR